MKKENTANKKNIAQKGSIFVAIASVMWSFDGVLRRSLYSLPPAVVVFYEHLLGFGILLFAYKKWSPDLKKMGKKEWMAIAVVGLFSGALGTIFYTAALGQVQYIQYSVVILLQQLQPVWAIIASAVLLREKISGRFVLLALLALCSAYLVAFKDLTLNINEGQGTVIAAGLALGAGVLWGSSTAVSKYVLNKISFLTATALRFLLAPVFAFIIILLFNQTQSLWSITPVQWGILLLITCTTGLLALGIYYYGLKKIPAHIATIIELLFPFSAVIIDFVYFKNPLSFTQIIGGLILLFAIINIVWLKETTQTPTAS